MEINEGVPRRQVLTTLAIGVLGLFTRNDVQATPADVQQWTTSLTGGKSVRDGKVTIKAPEFAENGNNVPITVTVESPMTDSDHVKAIHVMADGNPSPGIASFVLGPANGKAQVQVHARLAQTQNVVALVQMNDGSLWRAEREVKVAIGGCGG